MSNPTVEIKGATGTVFLTGRFTFDVQKAFKEAVNPLLDNPAIRTIAIDLSAASYMDSAALGILLLVRKRRRFVGQIAGLYFILEGIGRTVTEIWRGDADRGVIQSLPWLSTGRLTALAFAVFGVFLLFWFSRKKQVEVKA